MTSQSSSSASRKDLGERTAEFSDRVREWVRKMPRTLSSIEDMKQLVRSSGSVGANYIEANEAISRDDRIYRMKLCRKESKESEFWLRMLNISLPIPLEMERKSLMQEAHELMLIFNAIIRKY